MWTGGLTLSSTSWSSRPKAPAKAQDEGGPGHEGEEGSCSLSEQVWTRPYPTHVYGKWESLEAESDFNQRSRNFHQLVLSTRAATGALSCGTGDRAENDRICLEMAMAILDRIHNEEDSPCEIVTLEGK